MVDDQSESLLVVVMVITLSVVHERATSILPRLSGTGNYSNGITY